jgi:ATP-dependent exoDNAse (exonuclease V) beta subunit
VSKFNIYTASAGSGKTFQLTRHYLELLLRDTGNYKKILAVTFTNKAAGELKERVVEDLVKMSGEKPGESDHFRDLAEKLNQDEETLQKRAQKILRRILQDYGHFNIGTIDHFFQRVLRSFSKEIGINSGFKLELNSDLFIAGAIELLLSGLDEDPKLLNWLGKWADYQIDNDKSWASIEKELKVIGKELLKEEIMAEMSEDGIQKFSEDKIAKFEVLVSSIEKSFANQLKKFAEETGQLLDIFGLEAADFSGGANRSIPGHLLAANHDHNFLRRKIPEKGIDGPETWYKQSDSNETRKRIVSAWENGFRDLLSRYVNFRQEKEPVYNTAILIRHNIFSLGLSGKLMKALQKYSDETNSLLINLTSPVLANIIGNNPSPFIYEKAGTYYNHFMIDEFQDTSDLQWANFLPLIRNSLGEDDFSMVVGDLKQSIFRWRNSNWKLMDETARQNLKDFGIEDIPLKKNWRSREEIINFNNDFFTRAPGIVTSRIYEELKEYKGSKEIGINSISKNYSEVTQDLGKPNPGGYVKVSFEGEEDGWNEKIPVLIKELQQKYSYKPEDITFLVRRNKEARELVNLLQEYKQADPIDDSVCFDIVSSESYELRNSQAVRCLIWAIRYLLNPGEQYFIARLAHEYVSFKKLTPSEDDLRNITRLKNYPDTITGLIPAELYEKQGDLINISGARLAEEIIRILKLQEHIRDLPYLLAFRDKLLSEIGNTGNPEDILEWWDERGQTENVPMAEQTGAMRVLTVHKAKGLEFKVVIMPYCNWEMGQPKRDDLLWIKTENSDFHMIPLVPAKMGNQMRDSSFSDEYYREKIQIYLDNLNLLYVSFTRAIDRLYIYCPEPPRNVSYPASRLIREVLGLGEDGSDFIHRGNPDTYPGKKKDKKSAVKVKQTTYQPESFDSIFKLRQAYESDQMHYGTIMHAVLEKVITIKDLGMAVSKAVTAGEIKSRDADGIRIHLEGLLNRKDISRWYDGSYRIFAERGIIVPGIGEYRPDRIMENDEEMIILDYKFGDPRPSHHKQVVNYVSIVQKLVTKKVSGFLLYPLDGILTRAV